MFPGAACCLPAPDVQPPLRCQMFRLQRVFPRLELDFPNYQPALCSCLSEIIYSCQLLNAMLVGGVFMGIKMACGQIPSGKSFSCRPFAQKQGKMKRVGIRTSPPSGALEVNWASLSCGEAAKHELSTVSMQISRSQHSPWAQGCSVESPRAWQHPGKGHGLAAMAPASL